MDVKNQQLLQDLYVKITMVVKKLITIVRLVCECYIFEMALWKL